LTPVFPYCGRFAPSPSGPLHLGSMLVAFVSWLRARQANGRWLVRIEDVDWLRERPGAAQSQLATLAAFGLLSDAPVRYQSRCGALYQKALDDLLEQKRAFVCHCSRRQLAAQGGIHRLCVAQQIRRQPAIRFRVNEDSFVVFDDLLQGRIEQHVASEVGDVVLRRADGCWAYQFAVVVDDADQSISEVVRGVDLLASTPRQIVLQRALGLPTPAYLHLPLLLDAHGRKLSKSLNALPVNPHNPLPVLRGLWRLLGQNTDELSSAFSVAELLNRAVSAFRPEHLPRQSIPVCSAQFVSNHLA